MDVPSLSPYSEDAYVIENVYRPSDTSQLFHLSDKFIRALIGPYGTGKSVACCAEIKFRAEQQAPNRSGVRKSRWGAIRNTEPQLHMTTVKTWEDWFPPPVSITKQSPYLHANLCYDLNDGTRVDAEIIFLAMDRAEDTRKVLSLEFTGIWLNEARELAEKVYHDASSRVGRYPAKKEAPITWAGVIMDTNPPNEKHWFYELFEKKVYTDASLANSAEIWHYPAPVVYNDSREPIANPIADYVDFQPLGLQYWLNMMKGRPKDWIKVHVFGEYGFVMDGKPVYPDFDEVCHVAKGIIEPNPHLELLIAHDYGRTPATVFLQYMPGDRLYVIDELCAEDMSVKEYANGYLRPKIMNQYAKWYNSGRITSVGDPAGSHGQQNIEKTCQDILAQAGFPTRSVPQSQDPDTRIESVNYFMLPKTSIQHESRLLISPKCVELITGFRGGYKFGKVAVSGEDRYKEKPVKNIYSHIHDALQYGAFHCAHPNLQSRHRIGSRNNRTGRIGFAE